MASILKQRDFVVTLKRETYLNIGILSKLHPMSTELYRYIFEDNGLEKPTQNLFNHLSYYLVNIIDTKVNASLPWPLYDTKTERAYRNELSNYLADYSSKGLLTPIMSSYLVNPSCYKVTVLIFQLSQLAIQHVLVEKMKKNRQKELYTEVTNKFKLNKDESFFDYIENEKRLMLTKFSHYINKRYTLEKIAELFRGRISNMEAKLVNAHNYLNNLVECYINKHQPDATAIQELLNIKNVKEQCGYFDVWLKEVDDLTSQIESKWDDLSAPLLNLAKSASESSKTLIGRQTGEIDRRTFTLEYNPKTDLICTKELQCSVNSEQKYILKNIEKDNRLNFPNLVRSYVIAICYILKNNMIGDEIYKFNEYLNNGVESYSEITDTMKMVNERLFNAESKLQIVPANLDQSISLVESIKIPPLPDLSNLKAYRDNQFIFDTNTPMGLSKHQFNLRKKSNINFMKPPSKSVLFSQFPAPCDNFLQTLVACRVSMYDRPDSCQDIHNISMMSHINKANETIAECSSGFTKQQISRLLSTKKTSSSKKFKYKSDRPNISIKKGGLFNESISFNESSGLFRSYSSPNLFENRERRPLGKGRARKLSIMKEDSPNAILEVSGIAALDKNSNFSSPQDVSAFEGAKLDKSIISKAKESGTTNNIFSRVHFDLDKELGNGSIGFEISQKGYTNTELSESTKTETPKSNPKLVKKTNSLEKIINRYKKVRANILPSESFETPNNIRTIVEEKENNFNLVNDKDEFTASRILLPDLLSPNFNVLPKKTQQFGNDHEDFCLDMDVDSQSRRPRESLGTVLGVDHTFLDQFDLID